MDAAARQTRVARHSPAVVPRDDVLSVASDLLTKVRTVWMQLTYPFAAFGRGVSIHYSCEIRRSSSSRIYVGDSVYIAAGSWLNVPEPASGDFPVITLGNRCKIGRRCMISAKNEIRLEDDVMVGPSVVITDHSHEFSDVALPIHAQGLTEGGRVRVERNCWLGHGAAIISTSGTLVIGRNSVVGANAVVTRSVPPCSVVAGNPAKIVKRYDSQAKGWVRAGAARTDASGQSRCT